MATTECQNCGKDVNPQAIACANCGTPVVYTGGASVSISEKPTPLNNPAWEEGKRLLGNETYEKAVQAFGEASAHAPTQPGIHIDRAEALSGLGRNDEAEEAMAQATALGAGSGPSGAEKTDRLPPLTPQKQSGSSDFVVGFGFLGVGLAITLFTYMAAGP